jgi:bla regulator protein blaR1
MKTISLGVALCVCTAPMALGQPRAKPLTFEVASVKRSPPDAPGMFIRPLPGGGLRVTGASLKNLIALAYELRGFQISGGPNWIDSERFDIEARSETSDAVPPNAPTNMSEEQRKINERLRNLLADRFQLTLHRETKEQPVYALVVSRGGPKFQESGEPRGLIRGARGTITGQATTMGMLALNLSNVLGRRVIDQTGLTGKYSFELKWAFDQPAAAPLPGSELPASVDSNGPSIFTALPEQLGLRLESQKGPVEILVISRAEKPSEN